MSRFLITTALEETWRDDGPVLFLGEWCRLYDRRQRWEALDAEVVPYHWDDRAKLQGDYQYLQDLCECLLAELAQRLNDIHAVDHGMRYWRILVGPWLTDFVQILFDRWSMIERALRNYSISGVRVLDVPAERIVPNDNDQFREAVIADAWNEAICGQLLRGWSSVPIETVPSAGSRRSQVPRFPLTAGRRAKDILVRTASMVSGWAAREDEALFLGTYLPARQDAALQWRIGQWPKRWRSVPPPSAQVNWARRQWQLGDSSQGGFPAIAQAMIPRHIPTVYLEGYVALRTCCAALTWPRKPRAIFTATAQNSDDVFKAWAAKKVEEGAPLIIGQHGGHYCVGRWSASEAHELAICDAWLTWGTQDERNAKLKPVGNLKTIGRKQNWDPEGGGLMVEMSLPRYSYHMYSVPVASQWLDYFEDQSRFVAALSSQLRTRLLVRLYRNDYGWCQRARWRDRFPEVCLDDGAASIYSLIGKSRLCVSTYNATTYLETLAMNVPTIMFWNPSHWELRESAMPYFDKLKSAGIFHDTPESAARQLELVWNDTKNWWNGAAVQAARMEFCQAYSRMPEDPLEDLGRILSRISRPPSPARANAL